MKLAPSLLLAVALTTTLAGASARSQVSVAGDYQSNWDEVQLRQRGDRVTGTYVCCGGGTIEGRIIEGRILRYRWQQPGAEGHGVWTIGDGRLDGTWGWGMDDDDGGRWDLVHDPKIAH